MGALGSLTRLQVRGRRGAPAAVPVSVLLAPAGLVAIRGSRCLGSPPRLMLGWCVWGVDRFGHRRISRAGRQQLIVGRLRGERLTVSRFRRLRGLCHLLQLLVDLAGTVASLGKLGSLGEWLAYALAGVGDLALGMVGTGRSFRFVFLETDESVF